MMTAVEKTASDSELVSLTVKTTPAWREWLRRGAAHARIDSSKLVDISTAAYLASVGFAEPSPSRR